MRVRDVFFLGLTVLLAFVALLILVCTHNWYFSGTAVLAAIVSFIAGFSQYFIQKKL